MGFAYTWRVTSSLWANSFQKKKTRKQKSFGVYLSAMYLRVIKNIFRRKRFFFVFLYRTSTNIGPRWTIKKILFNTTTYRRDQMSLFIYIFYGRTRSNRNMYVHNYFGLFANKRHFFFLVNLKSVFYFLLYTITHVYKHWLHRLRFQYDI